MTPEERADKIVDGVIYTGWYGPRLRLALAQVIAAAIRARATEGK
jgi:hypothetical protein